MGRLVSIRSQGAEQAGHPLWASPSKTMASLRVRGLPLGANP